MATHDDEPIRISAPLLERAQAIAARLKCIRIDAVGRKREYMRGSVVEDALHIGLAQIEDKLR